VIKTSADAGQQAGGSLDAKYGERRVCTFGIAAFM